MPKITLEAARVNAGLTQEEAAKLLKIHWSTLKRWEEKPGIIKQEKIKDIERVYKIKADYIFFGD